MHSLDRFAQAKLDDLKSRSLHRQLTGTFREDGIWVERDRRRLLSFSCNDLSQSDPAPEDQTGGDRRGRSATVPAPAHRGWSLATTLLYAGLEARLAQIKQTEAAVVFGSGYLANAGIIPVFIGPEGLVLLDEVAHACLYAGRAIIARHGDDVPSQRPRPCPRIARPSIATDTIAPC